MSITDIMREVDCYANFHLQEMKNDEPVEIVKIIKQKVWHRERVKELIEQALFNKEQTHGN